jgi:UDP-glucose 4-epimerase
LAEKAPCHADVYNLASGTETSIKELVNLILEHLKLDILVHFDGTIPIGNPLNWKADINCLKKLGFLPEVTLDRGISVYTQWCRAELMG